MIYDDETSGSLLFQLVLIVPRVVEKPQIVHSLELIRTREADEARLSE